MKTRIVKAPCTSWTVTVDRKGAIRHSASYTTSEDAAKLIEGWENMMSEQRR